MDICLGGSVVFIAVQPCKRMVVFCLNFIGRIGMISRHIFRPPDLSSKRWDATNILWWNPSSTLW